jgi:predicted adenine nucleotide alpha hydrolase (AANH) superfamily ATPase
MKLLLHVCCAPCSTEVINRLSREHDVTGFFYNPNIHPRGEYDLRLVEFERFSRDVGFSYIKVEYNAQEWFDKTNRFEKEPEGGRRCEICFRIRLEETAKKAKTSGFDLFASTLSISPHKNTKTINALGREIERKQGIGFLSEDFKKEDGFKKSVQHSKKHSLIRQSYCGCIYSKKERESKQASSS